MTKGEHERPAPELLRKLLRYEPETGKLFWRKRTPDMFSDGKQTAEHICARWNSQYAGCEAFTSYRESGYLYGTIFGRPHKSHRVIWAMKTGGWPVEIDHINHAKDDNRFENLREVSHAENSRNQAMRLTNTSGVTGVGWVKQRQKWQAYICFGGRHVHLGYFDDKSYAIRARESAEVKYGFHPNHGVTL